MLLWLLSDHLAGRALFKRAIISAWVTVWLRGNGNGDFELSSFMCQAIQTSQLDVDHTHTHTNSCTADAM